MVACSGSGGRKATETTLEQQSQKMDTIRGIIFEIDSLSEDKIGTMELGSVGEGEIVDAHCWITNKLAEPLVILSVSGTCGCISPEIDTQPIKPGDSRELSFIYDSKGKKGRQISAIIIKSDKERYRLEIDVTVRQSN